MARYDERPVPRGISHRWEVLMSDDAAAQPPGPRLTALDVRTEHRVLRELPDTILRDMPLLAQGTPLVRHREYLDVHDPARAGFRAEGGEAVKPGQRLVSRADVPEEAWRALGEACDRVRSRRRAAG